MERDTENSCWLFLEKIGKAVALIKARMEPGHPAELNGTYLEVHPARSLYIYGCMLPLDMLKIPKAVEVRLSILYHSKFV